MLNGSDVNAVVQARSDLRAALAKLDASTRTCECCGLTVHNNSDDYRDAGFLRRAVKDLNSFLDRVSNRRVSFERDEE